jgi:hypothetical protein
MTFGSEDGGIVPELQSRHGHSAQPESQQVLAVLGAVLEVISSQGMPATPTSMFAAIMSAMETTDAQQSPVVSPSSQQQRLQQQQQQQSCNVLPHAAASLANTMFTQPTIDNRSFACLFCLLSCRLPRLCVPC